ncbi:MAG: hypothetical protein HY655_01420, partial [Acidobacteria bacterium]|nr:hypothetical protein [Acidobacteriota bacterium]
MTRSPDSFALRRLFALTGAGLLLAAAAVGTTARAAASAVYAAVGAELTQYDIDTDRGLLTRRSAVM